VLGLAVDDFLEALEGLNHALNEPVPSKTIGARGGVEQD
jgi:hypothetical protein